MLELDMIDAVSGRMVTSMYKVLKNEHEYAMNEGLTESGADEAARMAIEKLYNAMKEVDNEKR